MLRFNFLEDAGLLLKKPMAFSSSDSSCNLVKPWNVGGEIGSTIRTSLGLAFDFFGIGGSIEVWVEELMSAGGLMNRFLLGKVSSQGPCPSF